MCCEVSLMKRSMMWPPSEGTNINHVFLRFANQSPFIPRISYHVPLDRSFPLGYGSVFGDVWLMIVSTPGRPMVLPQSVELAYPSKSTGPDWPFLLPSYTFIWLCFCWTVSALPCNTLHCAKLPVNPLLVRVRAIIANHCTF